MKRSRTILTMVAMLGAIGLPAVTVTAQQATPAARSAAGQALPDFTEADIRAVLNARIAALKAVIDLTPDQEKLWPSVETAMREIAHSAAERLRQRQAAKPAGFLDVLGLVAAGEEARARDIRKFIAAAKPLVDSLNPEQRRRMPAFLGMTDYAGQPSGALWLFQEEQG